jgi:hypothetical protein
LYTTFSLLSVEQRFSVRVHLSFSCDQLRWSTEGTRRQSKQASPLLVPSSGASGAGAAPCLPEQWWPFCRGRRVYFLQQDDQWLWTQRLEAQDETGRPSGHELKICSLHATTLLPAAYVLSPS